MKKWLLQAGMIGVGCLALFAGFRWLTSDEPADSLNGDSQIAGLEEIDIPEPPAPHPAPKPVPKSVAARLELRLPSNQPVSLLKTVEQVLIQKIPEGDRVSHSSLELVVTMRLEETAQDGSQLLSVVYHRVRYRQDVAGRSFVFDSTVPSGQLPVEALPYKGLVGNGFSFWIGKDHRILKPVGFADFLKRCVREVPPALQQRVLMAFSEAIDESVASFVDDGIGFLPSNPEVREAATWNRERRLTKPIPLLLNSRCTLRRLTEQVAEIDIEGTIATPKAFAPPASPGGDPRVIVRGGHSQGRSDIDRKTGLPWHSEIKQSVDMEVRLADGRQFDQQKITTTTIRLFPQPSAPSQSGVIPAGAELPAN